MQRRDKSVILYSYLTQIYTNLIQQPSNIFVYLQHTFGRYCKYTLYDTFYFIIKQIYRSQFLEIFVIINLLRSWAALWKTLDEASCKSSSVVAYFPKRLHLAWFKYAAAKFLEPLFIDKTSLGRDRKGK